MSGVRAKVKWRRGWRGWLAPVELRPVMLWVGGLGLALITVGLGASIFLSLRLGLSTADVFALIGIEVALATFLLAALASVFAITAYAISSRRPDLRPQIELSDCDTNQAIFRIAAPGGNPGRALQTISGSLVIPVKYSVFNARLWSATNVDLRIELNDLLLPANFSAGRWVVSVRDEASNMVVAIQYQTDHIHGRVRFWPDAPDFSGLRLTGDQPAIMFFMHADAYASAKHLLVEIRD